MQAEIIIWDQLAKNLALLEPGLTLIQVNFPLPNIFGNKGNIDILAKDIFDNYVIIEEKRSKLTSRETLQEVLKYIGLIKHNFKARDSEIRVIIASTHWEELIIPFSELILGSTLAIKGIHILLDANSAIMRTETVIPIKISEGHRQLGRIYDACYFNDEGERD